MKSIYPWPIQLYFAKADKFPETQKNEVLMKTVLKIFGAGVLLMVILVIGITSYQFNAYTPQAIDMEPDPVNLSYFRESYSECRNEFIRAADDVKNRYEHVELSSIRVDSPTDTNLTIDWCYIPAHKAPKRLLILTSAVHGVEGYAGSAIQQMFLKELIDDQYLEDMGVLLIHAVNPYGFKNNRRFTENNIDLNRNSSNTPDLYSSVNSGYAELNLFLNPEKVVNLTGFDNMFFHLTAVGQIAKKSMGVLRQAVLQGQYQFEKGVYFGGKALEAPVIAVAELVQDIAEPYETVFSIDLHTGYGTNGTLHLFPDPLKDSEKKARIEAIFAGNSIDWGDSDDFYTVTGSFASYLETIIPEKDYMTMTFEFGTLDTKTTMGSIRALHNVIVENQGVQYGYKSAQTMADVKARYLEGYYPASEKWRSKVIQDARPLLSQALNKYSKLMN